MMEAFFVVPNAGSKERFVSKSENAHRMFMVKTFLAAGVPLNKIEKYDFRYDLCLFFSA